MSSLTSVALTIIVFYGLLVTIVHLAQERLLFFPSGSDPALESRYQEFAISFSTGEVELHGWFFPADEATQPTLVFYGGNGQEISTSIAGLRALGDFSYVLINYRGYGRSTGAPSETDLKSDALLILDSLEAQNRISIANTVIMGRSLGTGIATHVAANRETKGLILISPFSSIEAIASDIYFYLPVRWLIRHPFRSINDVAEISAPTLIIKAENDQIVPERYTDQLIEAWQGPLEVIKLAGTNHNYIETSEYLKVVDQFIRHLE